MVARRQPPTGGNSYKEKHNAEIRDVDVCDDDSVGDGGAGVCAGHDWNGCGHELVALTPVLRLHWRLG